MGSFPLGMQSFLVWMSLNGATTAVQGETSASLLIYDGQYIADSPCCTRACPSKG